ncbi:MAG: DegT/DnrJ/EryC1/StrS family aminotransferase [Phycisphaerae bacterium]|nr:DegT/DnrJ/EryC1/StrS family aminotransferase [Phycisphaerae bacterium]
MDVPLLDLTTQYAAIRDEVLAAVTDVLEGQLVCNGPAVRTFEAQVAQYCNAAHALGVSSGTDALLVTLMALGIGADKPACRTGGACDGAEEVITPAFTFFGTAGSIWRAGAKPVFVDIDPETFNLDPRAVAAAITDRTRAILPVHLYGQMCEMDALGETAQRHELPVIEDAAQAVGAEHAGRRAGSLGTAACLSFYPTKNLGAMGDAGMVLTQDADLAERCAVLRNHGQSRQYIHDWVGGNFRMDSIQAAALSVKLRQLDAWTDARRANAAAYNERLAGVDEVTVPVERADRRHIYHQYVIRAARRDELRAFLTDRGIASGVYYPLGLHLQACFAGLGYREGDLPETERACREVLALPVHPELRPEQLDHVAESIKAFYAR